MKLITILAMACVAVSSFAQSGTTTMVSSHLGSDLTLAPFTGRLCVTPMLADRATAFSADGAAQVLPTRTCFAIAAGVLQNAVVPDTSLANPPIGLAAVIQDSNGFNVYPYPQLLFPSGQTFNFDAYAPTQTAKVTTPTINFSTSAPTGDCGSAPALDYSGTVSNVSTWYCIAHQWALFQGSGGGGGAQADWDATSGPSEILNKPTLATVATSGSYNDLTNKPSIPAAQVNSDWNASSGLAQILNKPTLATVATSGSYADLLHLPSFATVATSGSYTDLLNKPTIPAAQVNSDWNSSTGLSQILNKPSLATVATSGSYNDLSNTPTLGTAAAQNTNAFDASGSAAAAEAASDPVGSASAAQSAAIAASQNYTDAHAVAPSTGILPASGGNLTSSPSGGLLNLQKIGQLYIIGDSYARGIGVNSYSQSFGGLLAKDTPAPVYNVAVGSTVTSQYVLQALNNFDPDPNFTTVSVVSGIENDSLGSGTGAPLTHYDLTESALLGWLTIPMANRTWVSTCTKTGSVFAYSGASSIYVPTFTWQTPLPALTAAMEPTAAGSTETCTITTPTSVNRIGINYGVTASSTTTFTVSVDGSLVTDACSGTTTFSNGPCNAFQNGQLVGLYRQEYSVTPATSHTIVLTYGSTGTGGQSLWQSIDWAVPNSASNNVVFQLATNAAWSNYALNNTAMQAVISQFRADGLPVNYVDVVNGVTAGGQTYVVNGTTDVATTATATCSASSDAKHPNTCGHEHIREAIQAAEYSAQNPTGGTGFVFSSPNLVNNQAVGDNAISNGPIMFKMQPVAMASAASIVLTNANPFGSVHITGTTAITSLTPWPICLGNQYTNCTVNIVFDTVGGGVGTGGSPYGFKQAITAPAAGTAVTFMYDSTANAWYPLGDAVGAAAAAQAAATSAAEAASAQKSANLSDLGSEPVALANLLGQPAAGTYSIDCSTSTSCAPVTATTGGTSGFPFTLGSTSISAGSTVTALLGLTVDGVSPTTFSFLDATSSIQTQLNSKANTSSLAAVATSGAYSDLSGTPSIPAAQVQSDWNASSGDAEILNKPTLGTAAAANSTSFDAAGAAAAAEAASDPSGSASTAILTAEAFAENASNISSGTLNHARLPALVSVDIPSNAANTSGSAGSLSAASALPSGTTATTQTAGDTTTKLATDSFATAAATAAISTAEAAAANASNLTSGTVAMARLSLPLSCQPGIGDGLNAITAGTYLTTTCRNETGQTWTITSIKCVADSGSSTCNVTNGAGTGLLTGAITGTSTYATGTQSGTTTISPNDYLKITFVADGSSKQIGIDVSGTY
jgi:hypothetical protein